MQKRRGSAPLAHQGLGLWDKSPHQTPAVNSQDILSFYSVRLYREVKMFEPMVGPRVCQLATGITKGKKPRMQSMLKPR